MLNINLMYVVVFPLYKELVIHIEGGREEKWRRKAAVIPNDNNFFFRIYYYRMWG